MDFIRSWKFTAIIIGVLCVVGLAGVIYGVATHGERDADLMEGFEPWPPETFPLRVCVHSYSSERGEFRVSSNHEDMEHARYVTHEMNDRLDFEAFVIVEDIHAPRPEGVRDCNVILTYGVPHETVHDPRSDARWTVVDEGGAAEFAHGYCYVTTTNVFGEIRTLVVQHELGHCLGLAHDDFETSIMRRSQSETPDRAFPAHITDHDRDLLRRTYQQ